MHVSLLDHGLVAWNIVKQRTIIRLNEQELCEVNIGRWYSELTHALEFLFEVSHVLTVCDFEVVIGIGALINTVWWSCSSNGKDGCWAFCPLSLADLGYTHHLNFLQQNLMK